MDEIQSQKVSKAATIEALMRDKIHAIGVTDVTFRVQPLKQGFHKLHVRAKIAEPQRAGIKVASASF